MRNTIIKNVGDLRRIIDSCENEVELVFQDEIGKPIKEMRLFVSFWKVAESGVYVNEQGAREVQDDGEPIQKLRKAVLVFDF